jgi:prephenate dehydratase
MSDRYAYLGPEGTFTEAALCTLTQDADRVPYASVPAALDAVRSGIVTAAMVPLENSVEGVVTTTLDELSGGEPLHIAAEVLLPVEFALLVRPGATMEAIKRIATHPHAEAQCRGWIAATLPDAQIFTTASTAAAAMAVADAAYDAAIAAPIAGRHYRLEVLAGGIGDRPDTVTRFVLVTRPGPLPEPTGADRTSLVAFIADDHPGALLEVLTEFSVREVNLSRIESRPTGQGMGRYSFSIDCEGHVDDARVGEALMGLRRVCPDVRFLGSYPRADADTEDASAEKDDAVYRDAAAWLGRIRSGRV